MGESSGYFGVRMVGMTQRLRFALGGKILTRT
jgi:hypothetical protein